MTSTPDCAIMISVIIPVYNAEKYIRECLNSVIAQTFQNFEIICVDDGSTDSSLSILNEYSDKYSNIRIISQSNQYAGVARNNGIKQAKGKYITFLDSDDLFIPNTLESMFTLAEENNSDVVRVSAFVTENPNKRIEWCLNSNYVKDSETFNWKDKSQTIFCISSGNPWGMMVKRSLVVLHNIQFLNTRSTEDIGFTYMAYLYANNITVSYKCLISHRDNDKGLENTKVQYPLVPIQARKQLLDIIRKEGFYDATYRGFWYAAIASYSQMIKKLVRTSYDLSSIKVYYDAIRTAGNIHPDIIFSNKADCPHILKNHYDIVSIIFSSKTFFSFITYAYSKRFYNSCGQLKNNTIFKLRCAKLTLNDYYSLFKSKIIIDRQTGPLVSIIIPVYNAEQFLNQCLDHLVKQSYKNIEIICVDDGSTDNSCKIIDDYIQSYNYITLIKQDNCGAGIARNVGFNQCKGDYVLFVDADDWVEYNLLDLVMKHFDKDSEADMVMYAYEKVDIITLKRIPVCKIHGTKTLNISENHKELIDNSIVVPWNKVMKKQFVEKNNLHFSDLKCANDRPYHFEAISKAKKIISIDKRLIHYRVNNSKSIIGLNRTINFKCHFAAFEMVSETYQTMGAEYYSALVDATIGDCFHFYDRAPPQYKKQIGRDIVLYIDGIITSTNVDITSFWWFKKYIFLKSDLLGDTMVENLEKIANNGDKDAMFRMGRAYRDGDGVDPDKELSKTWYKRAYDAGHMRAGFELAELMLPNDSERKEAIEILNYLSTKGDKDAVFKLARMYRDGTYLEKDSDKALNMMRRAGNLGNKRARLELAEMLAKSENDKDIAEAITICLRLSEEGDKDAMFRLSRMSADEKTKISWLRKAADNGHKTAMEELNRYEREHVKNDMSGVFSITLKKAEFGDINSMIKVARMYRDGIGVTKNNEEALSWFKKASPHNNNIKLELADLMLICGSEEDYIQAHELLKELANSGDRNAIYKLSKVYKNGIGVEKDPDASLALLRTAAKAGHSQARLEYAEHLSKSDNEEDRLEAFKECNSLAEKGNKDAMFRLGILYRDGVGTEPDRDKARSWFIKAAKNGHTGASNILSSFK